MALFDLTSSWVTGRCCELAARGYSRDRKKGLPQIEYGILTDPDGRPVAVRVFPGNTADPVAFTEIVEALHTTFGLHTLVLVGDRGMITAACIAALGELNEDAGTGFGWITALRAPAIATLAADDGPLQMSLFDNQDLAEITHPDYPGERLIACRNPALAAERARKRTELLDATEADLAHIADRVPAAPCTVPTRSAKRSGGSSGNTTWANIFTALSPTPASPSPRPGQHRRPSPPRRHLRAAHVGTRHRPRPGRGGATATRISPTLNATSAASKPTTWICAPSTTGSPTASKPTC